MATSTNKKKSKMNQSDSSEILLWKAKYWCLTFGHIALLLPDKTYISFWPSDCNNFFWKLLNKKCKYSMHTLDTDIAHKGQPDMKIELELDEEKIQKWHSDFIKKELSYNCFFYNCSTVVSEALLASCKEYTDTCGWIKTPQIVFSDAVAASKRNDEKQTIVPVSKGVTSLPSRGRTGPSLVPDDHPNLVYNASDIPYIIALCDKKDCLEITLSPSARPIENCTSNPITAEEFAGDNQQTIEGAEESNDKVKLEYKEPEGETADEEEPDTVGMSKVADAKKWVFKPLSSLERTGCTVVPIAKTKLADEETSYIMIKLSNSVTPTESYNSNMIAEITGGEESNEKVVKKSSSEYGQLVVSDTLCTKYESRPRKKINRTQDEGEDCKVKIEEVEDTYLHKENEEGICTKGSTIVTSHTVYIPKFDLTPSLNSSNGTRRVSTIVTSYTGYIPKVDLTPSLHSSNGTRRENFRALCTGAKLVGFNGSSRRCVFHGSMCQRVNSTDHNGTGGKSIFGNKFADENFTLKHTGPGSTIETSQTVFIPKFDLTPSLNSSNGTRREPPGLFQQNMLQNFQSTGWGINNRTQINYNDLMISDPQPPITNKTSSNSSVKRSEKKRKEYGQRKRKNNSLKIKGGITMTRRLLGEVMKHLPK